MSVTSKEHGRISAVWSLECMIAVRILVGSSCRPVFTGLHYVLVVVYHNMASYRRACRNSLTISAIEFIVTVGTPFGRVVIDYFDRLVLQLRIVV